MIEGASLLGLITARGGSKGIPKKNICLVGGKPLIAWTIEAATSSRYLDRIVLSSNDPEIISVAEQNGCDVPFVRPDNLASDEASSVDVALHALSILSGYEYLVLLQPTSPLRVTDDIDGSIELCHSSNASSSVSVTTAMESPALMFTMSSTDKHLVPALAPQRLGLRRQDLPEYYLLNGAVYVIRTAVFVRVKRFVLEDTVGYRMPRSRSLDVDTPEDLKEVDRILHHNRDSKTQRAT